MSGHKHAHPGHGPGPNVIHHALSLEWQAGVLCLMAIVVCAATAGVLRISSVELLAYRGPRLRWSWGVVTGAPLAALAGLVGAALLGLSLAAGAAAGALGAMAGAVVAGILDFEDRRSPKEQLRRRREELRGPVHTIKRVARARAAASGNGLVDGEAILGLDLRGSLAGLSGRELIGGGEVVGNPGTGKTNALRRLIRILVAAGWGVVGVAAKASPGETRFYHDLAAANGRPFPHFDVGGDGGAYNPLAGLSAIEAREFLMRVFRDDFDARSAVYRTAMSNRLLLAARVLEAQGDPLAIDRICDVWSDGALVGAARGTAVEDEVAAKLAAIGSDGAGRDGVASGLARLEELVAPAAGRLGGPGAFSLGDALVRRPRPVCLLSLDTQRFPEAARALAGLIVQDLAIAGGRFIAAGRKARIVVAMDEAARYVPENVADFMLQVAREAGIATVLATQTPADFDPIAQAFRQRASGGVAWLLGFRLDAEGADWFGRETGMRPRVEATVQHEARRGPTGLRTEGAGYEMKVHPSRIQDLPDGQAVLVRRPRADARIIKTWKEDR